MATVYKVTLGWLYNDKLEEISNWCQDTYGPNGMMGVTSNYEHQWFIASRNPISIYFRQESDAALFCLRFQTSKLAEY